MDIDSEVESSSRPEPATQLDVDVYEHVEESSAIERRQMQERAAATERFSDVSLTAPQTHSRADCAHMADSQTQSPEAFRDVPDNAASATDAAASSADELCCMNAQPESASNSSLSLGPLSGILKDLICPICLEYFFFPVTVSCGHTFCRYCIGHNKLSGKTCPLCRQPIGKSFSINTILTNLVKSLNLRKRTGSIPLEPQLSPVDEQEWWDENCLKPQVCVVLFLRIYFGDVAHPNVFFDDLVSCVIDFFNSGDLWERSKYLFTLPDLIILKRAIGYDRTEKDSASRLYYWVEDRLLSNPLLCSRRDTPPFLLKVFQDTNHKIEGKFFFSDDIPNKLPWDAGRHAKSLLHMSHSSVSLSHLLLVPTHESTGALFGLVDCGSTIGTMIRLKSIHTLADGDRIHIGDKHEAEATLSTGGVGSPYRGSMWDPVSQSVVDHAEALTMEGTLEPIDSHLSLKIFSDGQQPKDEWIDPKGVIIGRGPISQSAYKKISITIQNGYISREHCLLFYDGSKPAGSRWILRDLSTLGTFLKIPPCSEPVLIHPGVVFKVGQCKIETLKGNSLMSAERALERVERGERMEDERLDFQLRGGERLFPHFYGISPLALFPSMRQGPYDYLAQWDQERSEGLDEQGQPPISSYPMPFSFQRMAGSHQPFALPRGNSSTLERPHELQHSQHGGSRPEVYPFPPPLSVSNAYSFSGSNVEEPDGRSSQPVGAPYPCVVPPASGMGPMGLAVGVPPAAVVPPGQFPGDMQAMIRHAFLVTWDSYLRGSANAGQNDPALLHGFAPSANSSPDNRSTGNNRSPDAQWMP